MPSITVNNRPRWRAWLAACFACHACWAHAQHAEVSSATVSLKGVFESAWSRQPEAQAREWRDQALAAQQRAAQAWTPEPVAVEINLKSDQWHRNQGARDHEYGLAMPVWLPGERRGAAVLADAERTAFDRQINASRLRLAGEVRGAWWALHRARIEKELAAVQLAHARQIAADVSRRVKAGDLARADQHQADGAVAAAQVALAQTEVAFGLALESLRALAGRPISPDAASAVSESLPDVPADFFAAHTDVEAVASRAQVAAQSAQLAAVRTRANPELFLASGKDRSAAGETWSHKMVIGVRLPFGGPKQDAALAHAKADAAETEAHVALKRAQLQAEWDSARAKVSGMREALAASEARATLARESRRLFEKSFALGQTDLPTRLRIETEAIEAERQVVRSRMDLAAAISALRQAAGLLPE